MIYQIQALRASGVEIVAPDSIATSRDLAVDRILGDLFRKSDE